jgi:hypothetical protein
LTIEYKKTEKIEKKAILAKFSWQIIYKGMELKVGKLLGVETP